MSVLRDLLGGRRTPASPLHVAPASKTAFVLGGGGNLGAIQVGMLQALLERGIVPDLLVGCSVGALNAAALAGDPTPTGAGRLRDAWLRLRGTDIFPTGHLNGPWAVVRKGDGMYSNESLRRLIDSWLPYARIEDARVPLHVVATSLRTGRERWFDSGPAAPALLASAALPAIFPPVVVDGEPLIDGGVVDNVPISRAVALGATRVYVLHVGNFDRERPEAKRPIDVLVQAFSIARSYRFRLDSVNPPDGVDLVVLPGVDPGALKYNDFTKSRELMSRGRMSTAAFLESDVLAQHA